jgi:hypothetical protein
MMRSRYDEAHRPRDAALAGDDISGGSMAFDANTTRL